MKPLPPALRWYCAPGKVFGCSRFFAVLVDLMRTKPGLEVSLGVSATTLFIPSTFLSWVSQTSAVISRDGAAPFYEDSHYSGAMFCVASLLQPRVHLTIRATRFFQCSVGTCNAFNYTYMILLYLHRCWPTCNISDTFH